MTGVTGVTGVTTGVTGMTGMTGMTGEPPLFQSVNYLTLLNSVFNASQPTPPLKRIQS